MKTIITIGLLLTTCAFADPACPTGDDDDDIMSLYRANTRQDEQIENLKKEVAGLKLKIGTPTVSTTPAQKPVERPRYNPTDYPVEPKSPPPAVDPEVLKQRQHEDDLRRERMNNRHNDMLLENTDDEEI